MYVSIASAVADGGRIAAHDGQIPQTRPAQTARRAIMSRPAYSDFRK
jgi:hypothetical protein